METASQKALFWNRMSYWHYQTPGSTKKDDRSSSRARSKYTARFGGTPNKTTDEGRKRSQTPKKKTNEGGTSSTQLNKMVAAEQWDDIENKLGVRAGKFLKALEELGGKSRR